MARAAFAPIDLSLPTKRVSAMLEQVRPSCIIIADGCCHDDLVRSGIQGVDGLTPPPSIIGAGELLSAVRGAREDESGHRTSSLLSTVRASLPLFFLKQTAAIISSAR